MSENKNIEQKNDKSFYFEIMFYVTLVISISGIYYIAHNKKGEMSCKGYYINCFLYFLFMLSLYGCSITFQERFNFNYDMKNIKNILLINCILAICLIIIFMVNKSKIQHPLMIIIIILTSVTVKNVYYKYSEGYMLNMLKYTAFIVFIGIIFRFLFRKYIIKRNEIIIYITAFLAFTILTFDQMYLDNKMKIIINYSIVVIFMIFVLFDVNRILDVSQHCQIVKDPSYIENIMGLFLNIVTIYNNLSEAQYPYIEDESNDDDESNDNKLNDDE